MCVRVCLQSEMSSAHVCILRGDRLTLRAAPFSRTLTGYYIYTLCINLSIVWAQNAITHFVCRGHHASCNRSGGAQRNWSEEISRAQPCM